ncbi:pilus assembly protein PilM [Kiritimatiellaeota bacterium B1221]|nr:pilus assembly protein PilM [Kiritimatiellaeota bacterium B1221]
MRTTSKSAVGIDIGHHSIKVVQAVANGQKLRILRAEELPLPLDLSETGKTIRRWWEESHLGNTPVVAQVGGSRVLYQHITMEAEDPREFAQVGNMEAMRFSEMTDAQMEVSVSPASNLKQERKLLLGMARPDLLEMALSPLVSGKLNIVNACPAPVALYNGYIGLGEPIHQPTLFVNLGASHTEVLIGDGQGVRFARSFALGSAQITQSLAARSKIPYAQAERIRLKAETLSELPAEMGEVLQSFVRQWVQELNACLQIFSESNGKSGNKDEIRRMMLCGGGSQWKPLQQQLKSELAISISYPGSLPGLESSNSPAYVIACGLAADALGIARASSSLLTPQIRQSLNRKRNKQYWAITSVFSVAALAMFGAATQISFQREKKLLDAQTATLQRMDVIRKDNEALLHKQEQVDKMIRPLSDFVSNSTRIRDITLFIAREKDPEDFLTFLGDSESYLQIRLENADEKQRREISTSRRLALQKLNRQQAEEMRDARMNRIIVEGYTHKQDLSTVKTLIEKLATLPAVKSADLLNDDLIFEDVDRTPQWASTRFTRFVLDLQLIENLTPHQEEKP